MNHLTTTLAVTAALIAPASARAETLRAAVEPGATIVKTTHHRYPTDFADWTARIDGMPTILAEAQGNRRAWLYGHGLVAHLYVRCDGRWRFRMTNVARRQHRIVIRFHHHHPTLVPGPAPAPAPEPSVPPQGPSPVAAPAPAPEPTS